MVRATAASWPVGLQPAEKDEVFPLPKIQQEIRSFLMIADESTSVAISYLSGATIRSASVSHSY